MTKQEFDKYSFSINTEIDRFGEDQWVSIAEVNFVDRFVGIESGQILNYDEFIGIRN